MTAWTYPLKQTWKPTWRSFLLHSLLLQINRKVTPFKKTISWSKNLCGNKKPSHPTRLISSHLVTHTRNEFIMLTPIASLPIFLWKQEILKTYVTSLTSLPHWYRSAPSICLYQPLQIPRRASLAQLWDTCYTERMRSSEGMSSEICASICA